MRQRLFLFLLLAFVLIGLDIFIYNLLIQLSTDSHMILVVRLSYIVLSISGYIALYSAITTTTPGAYPRKPRTNLLSGYAGGVLIAKLSFVVLIFIFDLLRGLAYMILLFAPNAVLMETYVGQRNPLFILIALLIAIFLLISMVHGIIWGKYKFTVEHVDLSFPNLPIAFDGLRIAQISDAHSGTWDSVDKVAKGIKLIQDQNPDMILFTGDLVNSDKDEIKPYMHLFASLSAPLGKYAILGNHDYYGQPRDKSLRPTYWEDFYAKYRAMGFDLIMNDNRLIIKDDNALRLLGVENWGNGKWFPKFGDLDKALKDVADDEFTILMSHDPTHWDEKVLPHDRSIDLTLSGHTHGMQFGINWGWLRWSPVKYRYKRWIGIHEVQKQKLYINRGFGFLGFPARVGMWPEISILKLKKDV